MQLKHVTFAAIGLVTTLTGSIIGYRNGYQRGFHNEQALKTSKDYLDQRWDKDKGDPIFTLQIKDATARWGTKNGISSHRVNEEWMPIVMSFPDQNCVQLILHSGSLGGEPVYCYKGNSTELMKEYSDVE